MTAIQSAAEDKLKVTKLKFSKLYTKISQDKTCSLTERATTSSSILN